MMQKWNAEDADLADGRGFFYYFLSAKIGVTKYLCNPRSKMNNTLNRKGCF